MKPRAYTLIELLISLAIILILMMAVGNAIVTSLHLQSIGADRAGMSRSATELAERLGEEARSSSAVFIPSSDVFGNPNSGSAGPHEVDFLRRLSEGGDAMVAYNFDASSSSVTRYEYTSASGAKRILNSDLAADGIAAFSLLREPVAGSGNIVGQSDPASVTIFYGGAEFAGGNDVVVASILAGARSGIPSHLYVVHLASRAAPTSLAILAPVGLPPSPPATKVFPFVILRPGFPVSPPHGPIHGASPGGSPLLLHFVAAGGSIEFATSMGQGAINWFDFTLAFASVTSGTYSFKLPDGSIASASISCVGGPCPNFHPSPVIAPAFTPQGGVAFQLSSP